MTRASRQCAHCGAKLIEGRARFEVHVAKDHPANAGQVTGVFCNAGCWMAARDGKIGDGAAKNLISDAECVLSDEGKITG